MTKSCIYNGRHQVQYHHVTGLLFSDFDHTGDFLESEAVYGVAVMVGNRSQSLRLQGVAKGSFASLPFPLHCVWVVKEQEL
jgi:hypothetical protein